MASSPTVVFFDMETTGFDEPVRPVQIGAVDSWGHPTFDQYINPGRTISRQATRIHRMKIVR
jgi:DNA polymerase III epsilon subunit-like protein